MNTVVEHKTNPEFAAAVGITRSMASRLRSGDRRPSTRVAFRILEALCPPERYAEGMEAFSQSGEVQERFLASLVGPVVPTDGP
jgi:transcriptional regulator with XRE-family HTH domain